MYKSEISKHENLLKCKINGTELHRLIPQAEPIIMIGTLLFYNKIKTITSFTIDKNNIFCRNGKFVEAGLIENMAQTAAVAAGYKAKINNTKIRTGFIGAVKNLKIYCLPKINQTLETKIIEKYKIGDVSIVNGKIIVENNIVAECEMKIFLI